MPFLGVLLPRTPQGTNSRSPPHPLVAVTPADPVRVRPYGTNFTAGRKIFPRAKSHSKSRWNAQPQSDSCLPSTHHWPSQDIIPGHPGLPGPTTLV